ncbi:glycosyltransferase family A protein [Leucobacter sp. M11]|uniref:glycosyltransferase family A protein n=1 Tax=Leucobacter sp. M11 TaxID=2993565 RepID=UPI002D7E1671|nr:glycosyltransferase family A protein [Leucobacter sp. M11]MEB4615420.1 glycosyltransferase family A protein [Leucobacter sp. M11]
MTPTPLVEVVIAVHDPRRPVLRAIRSVLAAGREDIRVSVVCHGIAPEEIPGLTELTGGTASHLVRLLPFSDGVRSPAGPFNHGIEQATGRYVSVMGSDDWLAPGALNAWVELSLEKDLDIFLAGLQHQHGTQLRNPPVRPWRRHHLDTVKDRLFHRSAPLGLLKRSLFADPVIRFSEGLATGEDLVVSTLLFARAKRISVGLDLPRYIIGSDASDRVTASPHTMLAVLAPLTLLRQSDSFRNLPGRVRIAAQTARIKGSILQNAVHRTDSDAWTDEALAEIREHMGGEQREIRAAVAALPRSQRRLLDALSAQGQTSVGAAEAVRVSLQDGRIDRLFPRQLRYSLHRESTLVRYLGYALARLNG